MYYEHGIHDPHARSLLVDALKIGVVHVRGLGLSTAHYERDTRQECGHGLVAHHHLRRLGAGSPLLAQIGAWRAWRVRPRVCMQPTQTRVLSLPYDDDLEESL